MGLRTVSQRLIFTVSFPTSFAFSPPPAASNHPCYPPLPQTQGFACHRPSYFLCSGFHCLRCTGSFPFDIRAASVLFVVRGAQAFVPSARLRRIAAGLQDATLRRRQCRRHAAGGHHRAATWLDHGRARPQPVDPDDAVVELGYALAGGAARSRSGVARREDAAAAAAAVAVAPGVAVGVPAVAVGV